MLVYQRSEKDVPKAVSLYKKLSSGIPGCSDHVLHCLAAYALEKGQYDSVISHIQAMREKTIAEEKMLWAALIEKKKYADAEKLIHAYVHDHRDCFDGWYFLAKINIHYGKSGYAREYLKQALDAGYIDLDALNNDKELREVYRALS
jgi:predicted Zn-dependent protease